jgi:hypothetical protein
VEEIFEKYGFEELEADITIFKRENFLIVRDERLTLDFHIYEIVSYNNTVFGTEEILGYSCTLHKRFSIAIADDYLKTFVRKQKINGILSQL